METLGVFADAEWECFGKMFSMDDQIDLTSEFFGHPLELDINALHFLNPLNPEANEGMFNSQENSYNSDGCGGSDLLSSPAYFFGESNHILNTNMPVDLNNMDFLIKEASPSPPQDNEMSLKRKIEVPTGGVNSSENTNKKPRVSRDRNKNKKKNQKANEGEESSSSYSSEDDNGTSSSVALNLNGKPRASRGSATDPQSLYARKRRERINERLKILQNLVPNGTKVDISTMLEEAVNYVKFLQLQIKLLSSDDLWMYAPIAYNGIDVCLNQKISALL